MAGSWSLRVGPRVHSGLTLFRLEALVRSGTLEGDALVCSEGRWMRVDEVPFLRRHLERKEELRSDSNVIPFPIKTDAARAGLKQRASRQREQAVARVGRIASTAASLLLAGETLFLLWALLHGLR